VIVVERNNPGIGPQVLVIIQELVGTTNDLRVGFSVRGDVVFRGILPAMLNSAVPEREVSETENFPHAILLDVLILVDTALPPLPQSAGRVFVGLVGSSAHQGAETAFTDACSGIVVYHILGDKVVQEETLYGTISAPDES